jgi:predicted pyridoxine 5'-phosphate oxidase superfamily flavin-nucleotide-binding protein
MLSVIALAATLVAVASCQRKPHRRGRPNAVCARYCEHKCDPGPFTRSLDDCLSECEEATPDLIHGREFRCAAAAKDCDAVWRCFNTAPR